MHTRSVALLAVLTLLGLGCHASPPPTTARSVANPHERTSVSGAATPAGENRGTTSTTATNPSIPANVPPPAAGTSTPTQVDPQPSSAPYKPGNEPPAPIGGGPKTETGGSVYGEEDEGNTGAPKGGDGSRPGK
jgi:hypothetical protein